MTRTGVVVGVLATAASAHAQTFSRVEFYPEMRLDYVLAVADFNNDGRDDILAGGREEARWDGSPEDRHNKTALEVFFGQQDGTFERAADLIDGAIEAWQPIVVAEDFNNDEQIDLAVFDAGVYVGEESVGYGNPPQLWLSDDGVLRSSESLADAVRAEHALRPPGGKGISAPADLHIKTAAAGDIDSDGDLDLWVESTGGKNVVSHFMVNNGSGEFQIERDRATDAVFRNNPPDYWRHVGNSFVDVDNDGDLDLALGRIQDDGLAWRPYSLVVVNDGTGHYPSRIELPDPAFNDGHTAAQALAHFDVNSDGLQDLLLVHERDGPAEVVSFTGRYIQVLLNDDGEAFVDESSTWMGDQNSTTLERYPNGDPLHNAARPRMLDIDRDGCEDIVMANANTLIRTESPIFYLNNGSGQFQAVDPDELFTGMDWSGIYSVPADVNGDGVVDLVFPQRVVGPDDEYGTDDDSTRFLTLLNATPVGSVRCDPRVKAVGRLPAQTLNVGAEAMVVSVADAFQDALIYQASSSAAGVATASVAGSDVSVAPVAVGVTTITVTASGADNSIATQQFKVTVVAATSTRAAASRWRASTTWVRLDVRLERDLDVRFETVTVDDLPVSTSGASLRLVILDACWNNPLARSMQRAAATRTVSGGSFADLNEDRLGGRDARRVCGGDGDDGGGRAWPEQPLHRGAAVASGDAAGDRLVILDACWNNPLARSIQRTAATRTVSGGSFVDLNEYLLETRG